MISLIGLSVEQAKIECDKMGLDVIIIPYSSFKGVEDSDKTIVVREKDCGDNLIELVVCDFKTKVLNDE